MLFSESDTNIIPEPLSDLDVANISRPFVAAYSANYQLGTSYRGSGFSCRGGENLIVNLCIFNEAVREIRNLEYKDLEKISTLYCKVVMNMAQMWHQRQEIVRHALNLMLYAQLMEVVDNNSARARKNVNKGALCPRKQMVWAGFGRPNCWVWAQHLIVG